MTELSNIFIIAVSMVGLITGLLLKKLERSIVTEPMLAMIGGVILAQMGYAFPNVEFLTQSVALFTIVFSIAIASIRVPFEFLKTYRWQMVIMVFLLMAGMWMMTALLFKLFLNLNWIYCFMLGAIITPTDYLLSSVVTSGSAAVKNLPARLRYTLSLESGANNGLAFIVVALPLFMLTGTEKPFMHWLLESILLQSIGGIVLGVAVGIFLGKMVNKAFVQQFTSTAAIFSLAVFVSLFLFAVAELLTLNAFITVFSGILIYGIQAKKGNEKISNVAISDSLERLIILPIFFLFGMMLPIEAWMKGSWQFFIVAVVILLFRRIPVFFAIRPILKKYKKRLRDIVFLGWFGPIGVISVYYAILVKNQLTAFSDDIWPVASFIVFASVMIHGLSGYPLAKFYMFIDEKESENHIADSGFDLEE